MAIENVTLNISGEARFRAYSILTRNPQVVIALIWLMSFASLFWIFQHFLVKFLEDPKEKNWRYLVYAIGSFSLLGLLIALAIHWPSPNLLKPIADWFFIEYG
jgi:hypothetical protein